MSVSILIIGEPGTGKSASIRTLDPNTTCIIKAINKPLPFRGNVNYKSGKGGNCFFSTDYQKIINAVKIIDSSRPEIKTIVIDDIQTVMSDEFMERAKEKSYEKFTEIAQHSFRIFKTIASLRDDLLVYVLCHSTIDENGKSKCKTIGKLLEDKHSPEGDFVVIFHTKVLERKYLFQTQNDGNTFCRSPMDMFDELYIENDLNHISNVIREYYGMEEQPSIAAPKLVVNN